MWGGSTLSQHFNCKARLSKTVTGSEGVRFPILLWSAIKEEESSNFKGLKILVEEARAEELLDFLI